MTRPGNPSNYQCKGKMKESRGYIVHHWVVKDGVASCINKGCGVVLSAEDTADLVNTRRH